MAERRLPFAITDDKGTVWQGEVVIVGAWQRDLEIGPRTAFTIVLAQHPLAPDSHLPPANVIVCAPESPVRLSPTVAEPTSLYEAGTAPAPPTLRLPRRAIEAYARGAVLSAQPLPVSAGEVFSGPRPRFDLLASELLAAAAKAERYWAALDEVLSWPAAPASPPQPERVRTRLRRLIQRTLPIPEDWPGSDVVRRLSQIAEGALPGEDAPSPAALAEDVAFLRCIESHREAALELSAIRAYVDGVRLPSANSELAADLAFTKEQLSFLTLLQQPHQLDSLRATFELFRSSYVQAYVKQHDAYWSARERLRPQLAEAGLAVRALGRLNTLRALGPAVGATALAAYQRLVASRSCSAGDLEASLRTQPACGECGISMEDAAPSAEVEGVLRELRSALATQQARLASEAVRRILARGGERIDQFLRIVQASDTPALAHVLDDELLAFLQELLAEPVSPTPEALGLFEELARAYPTVSEEQVDAVVQTLRQLLTEQLASQRATDPSHPAALRLASTPPP